MHPAVAGDGAAVVVAAAAGGPRASSRPSPARRVPTVRRARNARLEQNAGATGEENEDLPATPRPRSTPFGSVWDSQLGTSSVAPSGLTPLPPDEEFDDEPEIPEYLIAERNRGRGSGSGTVPGARWRARRSRRVPVGDRPRAVRSRRRGGINRYPDVSERTSRGGGGGSGAAPRRDQRGGRDDRAAAGGPAPRPGSEWSEVPPELEEMLRAQLGQKAPTAGEAGPVAAEAAVDGAAASVTAEAATTTRRRTTRKPAATATGEEAPAEAAATGRSEARASRRQPRPRPRLSPRPRPRCRPRSHAGRRPHRGSVQHG